MKRTWEQEKAYRARRAEQIAIEMDAAIEAEDLDRFAAAWEKAMYYMTGKQRRPYYIRMLEKGMGHRAQVTAIKQPTHCGFEAEPPFPVKPLPAGTTFVNNPDGTVTPVYPTK